MPLPNFFLCLIALFAGFTQGLSGFGSVLVALPVLTYLLDLKTAVPLASTWGMTINIILLIQLRPHLSRKRILPLAARGLAGHPPGGVYPEECACLDFGNGPGRSVGGFFPCISSGPGEKLAVCPGGGPTPPASVPVFWVAAWR